MTICAAKDCQNTSLKGVKMCYFPSNPEQRAKWVSNVGRENWLPNKHSALCEYHFVADAFEKERVDGTKKLKLCAVPTIFGELVTQISNQQKKRKTDTECHSEETGTMHSMDTFNENQIKQQNTMISVLKPVTQTVIQKCTEENPYFQEEVNILVEATVINRCTEGNVEKEGDASALKRTCSNSNTEVAELLMKCKNLEQLYKQSEKSKIKMKRTHKQKEMTLRRKIKILEQQVIRTTVTELWMHQLQTHGFNI